MRTTLLAALLLAAPSLGCGAVEKSYRELTPDATPALAQAASSPEADALVARFYGAGPAVDGRAIEAALARAPGHSGLHEIAGYDAVVHGDTHAAFEHFLAAAADKGALSPELYLYEMRWHARATTEHLQAQALLRELSELHPRPAVRQLAAFDLARELRLVGEYDEVEQLVRGLGFFEAWQVLGSFDNDQGKGFQTAYAPEHDADPARTYTGVRLPIRFRPLAASPLDGAVQLGDALSPADAAVAYAQTWIAAARGRQVDLRLTTTNAVRVWLNGALVASDDKIYHEELDNVVVRVTLAAGQNRLLVKSAHETGPFRLAARITELDGTVPADLHASWTKPSGSDGGGPRPPPNPPGAQPPLVSPMGAIDKLADKNRKSFLQARLWAREGHARRASWFLEPLLRAAPDNRVVMYYAAQAMVDSGEAGKALDVLNRGVATNPRAAGFLLDRARFQIARKRWDKADADLAAAIQASPSPRDAMMDRALVQARREWTIDRCQELDAIVTRWPDDSRAIADLGQCKLDEHYVEQGERLLRRAHALVPGETYILQRLLGVAEQRLDYGAAEGWLRELSQARPTSPEISLEQAELYRRQGKIPEATSALEAARAQDPDSPWPYDRLAQLALEARNRPEAERSWRLALARDPDNGALAQRLAALAPGALPLGDRLAPTADDIDRAVRSASGVKVHPGSQQVVLLDDGVTTVNPDGSSKHIVTLVRQAINTEGRDALTQSRLPTSGRVNVIEAYSIKRNGERQDASSTTGGAVRFRGLETGSITVLQYAHYASPPRFLPNEFVDQWRFQDVNAQVEVSRWRLILPKDRTLNVETRGPVETTSEVVGDLKVWTLSARAVPPLLPEPNMTPAADELWGAAVSTLQSWDGYAHWEEALLADAFPPSASLDALAKRLTLGARTPREKVDRLWAHVAQEIRYQQDYEDTIAGVKPHAAGMVVERGYGDCKDKAVLLIRLARAVGVEMRFVVLRTTPFGKVWKQIPNQQFNHAIAYAPKQAGIDEGFFIDTTTNGLDIGNLRTDDEGALGLVMAPDTGRWELLPIPYQSADVEFVKHDITVDLRDPARVVGHDHIEARGGVAAGVRVALRNGEGAQRYYQSVSDQLFAGTTLLSGKAEHDQDLTRPLAVSLDIDLGNAVKPEDDRSRLDVPVVFPLAHMAALAVRQHPLKLWRGVQSLTMDVELGKGQQAFHVPPDFDVQHPCFSLSRKVETKGTHVVVRSFYKNTCAEVAPADYPAFRAAVQKAVARAQDTIVFSAGKDAKPARKK